MTASLVYSTSRHADNALRIARVKAAGRIQDQREARAAVRQKERDAQWATAEKWVVAIRQAGGVKVGLKVCTDIGKYRTTVPIDEATEELVWLFHSDTEAWGINAAGEHVGDPW